MHEWLSSKVALLSAEKESAKAGYRKLTYNQYFSNPIEKKTEAVSSLLLSSQCYSSIVVLAGDCLGNSCNVAEVLKILPSSFRALIRQHVLLFENEMSQLPGEGELEHQDPRWDGMINSSAHSEWLLSWRSVFESLGEESCESFFSCKSSREMSYAVVASVTLIVFGPRFELGMGEGKERGRDICESYFSTILSHCLFLLLFAVSSFHEFPLFSLLVYILCKQPPCPCELLIKVLQCT